MVAASVPDATPATPTPRNPFARPALHLATAVRYYLGEQVWRESTAQLREAADLFRRAADSGIGDASYQLGRLYQQGLGIPLDPVAAFDNFLAAADGEAVHPTAGEGGMGGGGGRDRETKGVPFVVCPKKRDG